MFKCLLKAAADRIDTTRADGTQDTFSKTTQSNRALAHKSV